ncbi:MAG: hypothetical protein KGY66_00520 [Candidatus Thermoplasmatota archaeon]|nr:hypothetical protein [Candidatus Thermoplasmatota archaeon]MBS3789388.1 hypothetical protein [Candidatus Thermoplasmatota archaeon]
MKILAVATDNFEFYYEIVRELKQRDIAFVSLSPTDPIPPNVDLVITTEQEAEGIDFQNIVSIEQDIRKGVRRALSILKGKQTYQKMLVGIDPGTEPGIALVGDGKILETMNADSPEKVRDIIKGFIEDYSFQRMTVRIGHGDKTNRNRTITSLKGLAVRIEIVNEEDTTQLTESPDIEAAKKIALSIGKLAEGPYDVEATEGEMREMQRRSRIESGEITISKKLAKKVVEGDMEMKEAINEQKEEEG